MEKRVTFDRTTNESFLFCILFNPIYIDGSHYYADNFSIVSSSDDVVLSSRSTSNTSGKDSSTIISTTSPTKNNNSTSTNIFTDGSHTMPPKLDMGNLNAMMNADFSKKKKPLSKKEEARIKKEAEKKAKEAREAQEAKSRKLSEAGTTRFFP